MNVVSLFSVPVAIINIDRQFTEQELKLFSDIPMWKDQNGQMTNHRSEELFLLDNFAELKDIKKFCEHHLENYLKDVEGVETNLATLRITQSWLNKTKPQERHHHHVHPNSHLSGTFYINCLPNDNIVFVNRIKGMFSNMEFPIKKYTVWSSMNIIQKVKAGDLIIFPSWVPHYVALNGTEEERISLSFNTFPVGKMGKEVGTQLVL